MANEVKIPSKPPKTTALMWPPDRSWASLDAITWKAITIGVGVCLLPNTRSQAIRLPCWHELPLTHWYPPCCMQLLLHAHPEGLEYSRWPWALNWVIVSKLRLTNICFSALNTVAFRWKHCIQWNRATIEASAGYSSWIRIFCSVGTVSSHCCPVIFITQCAREKQGQVEGWVRRRQKERGREAETKKRGRGRGSQEGSRQPKTKKAQEKARKKIVEIQIFPTKNLFYWCLFWFKASWKL